MRDSFWRDKSTASEFTFTTQIFDTKDGIHTIKNKAREDYLTMITLLLTKDCSRTVYQMERE
jgi:hypothetical protein